MQPHNHEHAPIPPNDSAAIGAPEGQPASATETSRSLAPDWQPVQMEDHTPSQASRAAMPLDPIARHFADIEKRLAEIESAILRKRARNPARKT